MNPQAFMDGIITGAMIGLGAIGITLTYAILRFSNFAHGDLLSWGAYLAMTASGLIGLAFGGSTTPLGPFSFGWSLPLGTLIAMFLTAALALVIDAALFGVLRRRKSASIILVMASFGAALAMRNLLEFLYTSSPAYYSRALQISRPLLGGMRATPDQLLVIGLAIIAVIVVHLLLTRTAAGRSMRAVAENQQLAAIAGIDVRAVIRLVWTLGAMLACISGVMSGLLIQIRPEMGFDLLLPMFAAAVLGGIGSVPGAMLAGLIVGLGEAFAVQLVGAEWRAAVSFVILILVLLVRPQGLFGKAA